MTDYEHHNRAIPDASEFLEDPINGGRTGTVPTQHGFVVVNVDTSDGGVIRMEVIMWGRLHTRIYRTAYSERYAATLAKRFAEEVAKNVLPPREEDDG